MSTRGDEKAGRTRVRPIVAVAVALPLLLALVVAGIGITLRLSGADAGPAPDAPPVTGPIDVGPATDPSASSAACAGLLRLLPAALPSDGGSLEPRPVSPAVDGARAWAAAPEPVVLRCGVPRPAELGPSSPLVLVNGVNWLPLPDAAGTAEAAGTRSSTYAVVDRGVYLTLSAPAEAGSGPLQAVSDAVAASLPPQPVRVR
ncbi:DUF3515 domain-containing protein [Pseudonocardia sp. KRD291]|uniref:DUF3515 domain-containing protein n=1 Tax=Pseudonocardia sp. KRD291 TaxID=2792007 RepID=UPI001C4A6BE3|nr:DUF3515 domain-containing protein [Pseudonocardia sp. KRD291]MBW0106743.1 DUF3515 domain-containing protein [Pseudonocardia sp. KRD291]